MVRAARVFASMCLAAIAAGGTVSAQDAPKPDAPKGFADMLDASRLPRMAGAQELFANKSTTSFVVRELVAQATEATRALLAAEGWQPYVARSGSNARHDTLAIMNFRKAAQGLNVFITVAPAQGGATSIEYTPIAIESDLPFPKDVTDIASRRTGRARRPRRPHWRRRQGQRFQRPRWWTSGICRGSRAQRSARWIVA